MTAFDLETLYDGIISHQKAKGFFDLVITHEPKSAPPNGVTAATFFQRIRPTQRVSGLASVSVRVEVVTRLYTPMLDIDESRIDPRVYRAATLLMEAYAGDFELNTGGTRRVMHVDLLGAHGDPLEARAGYLNQDGRVYRVFDIVTPLIIDDVWSMAA